MSEIFIEKPIVIMPVSLDSVLLYHALISKGANVLGFWDNNINLNGKQYNKKPISLPQKKGVLKTDVTVVIYSERYGNDLIIQLKQLEHENIILAHKTEPKSSGFFANLESSLTYNDIIDIIPKAKASLWQNSNNNIKLLAQTTYLQQVHQLLNNGKNKDNKKILLMSHHTSLVGSPIALHYAANILCKNGYTVMIYSPLCGSLLTSILSAGLPVLIDCILPYDKMFFELIKMFDAVILNTFTPVSLFFLKKLCSTQIATLWWLHESGLSYENMKKMQLPLLTNNIHAYSVGEYAQKAFAENTGNSSKIMLYGIEDFFEQNKLREAEKKAQPKIKFMTVGTINNRKGQDILCAAIRQMDAALRSNCVFYIIGKSRGNDEAVRAVIKLKEDFEESVILVEELNRTEMGDMLYECDCMVCASRDDPMPIFMTEAMMYSKICICSGNTGTSAYINDGINGFVYKQNSPKQLCEKMQYVVQNFQSLKNMKSKSREIYDTHFSMKVFEANLLKAMGEIGVC
jgi:glycosyltransferase involved in cell wall biosynthesis